VGIGIVAIVSASTTAGCETSGDAPAGARDAGTATEASAQDAPIAFGESPCGTCQRNACASEISACTDDPACARYLSCVLGCPVGAGGNVDSGCLARCPSAGTSSSVTNEDITALSACMENGPGTLCAGCGSDAGGGNGFAIVNESCPMSDGPATDCYTTEQNLCCHVLDACMASAACLTIGQCFGTCTSDDILVDAGQDGGFPSCREACIAQAPEGLAAYAAFDVCFSLRCGQSAACGGGSDPCGACLAANCAQAQLVLNLAPGGYGLFNCIFACNADKACEDACKVQYPAAVRPLDAFFACQQDLCGNPCGGGTNTL
jgi:hypothetical protein